MEFRTRYTSTYTDTQCIYLYLGGDPHFSDSGISGALFYSPLLCHPLSLVSTLCVCVRACVCVRVCVCACVCVCVCV